MCRYICDPSYSEHFSYFQINFAFWYLIFKKRNTVLFRCCNIRSSNMYAVTHQKLTTELSFTRCIFHYTLLELINLCFKQENNKYDYSCYRDTDYVSVTIELRKRWFAIYFLSKNLLSVLRQVWRKR